MKKITAFLFIVLTLTSCYTIRQEPITDEMDTWIGRTEHDLVLAKGIPSKTADDGAGGKIVEYDNTTYTSINYPSYYYGTNNIILPGISTTKVNTSYMDFYINSSDKVYNWSTNISKRIKVKDVTGTKIFTIGGSIISVIIFIILATQH